MAKITQQLLKINGVVFANAKDYSVEYNKLWTNSGRNLAGRMSATLVGVFPKIKGKTTVQTKEQFANMARILQQPQFNVEFYDFISQTVESGVFYAGDITIELKERERGLVEEISFSLIPYDKFPF